MGNADVAGARSSGQVTLAEIARLAGVSVPTVSKVINHRSDVSADTRRRVRALLNAYGYRSRSDAAPPTSIDVVMIDMDDAWAGKVLSAFEHAGRDAGLGVSPTVVNRLTVPADWVRRTLSRGSTGVIAVFVDITDADRRRLSAAGIGCVLVGPGDSVPVGVDTVQIDFRAGAQTACQHLLDRGHERIALLVGPQELEYNRDRYLGYREALHRATIKIDRSLVRWTSGFNQRSGRQETRHLLQRPDPPTAIIAGTDTVAIGVYEALTEVGLTPGEAVAVVGFDDRPEASWLQPGLTTIALPLDRIARSAVAILTTKRQGSPSNPPISGVLIERGSTAPSSA